MTPSPQANDDIAIVLTATIIPNGVASAMDPEKRLAEYVQMLKFYQRFGRVIFVENSHYSLEKHPEFQASATLQVRRLPPSKNPKNGKGYQEFEMLDAWLASDTNLPARWLKISGRYGIHNIGRIIEDCKKDRHPGIIIDQLARRKFARTYLFCIDTNFYQKNIRGIYRQCNDANGDWIEYVLFKVLARTPWPEARFFKTQPDLSARDGSSGKLFPQGRGQWLAKQFLRSINRLADGKYLKYQS